MLDDHTILALLQQKCELEMQQLIALPRALRKSDWPLTGLFVELCGSAHSAKNLRLDKYERYSESAKKWLQKQRDEDLEKYQRLCQTARELLSPILSEQYHFNLTLTELAPAGADAHRELIEIESSETTLRSHGAETTEGRIAARLASSGAPLKRAASKFEVVRLFLAYADPSLLANAEEFTAAYRVLGSQMRAAIDRYQQDRAQVRAALEEVRARGLLSKDADLPEFELDTQIAAAMEAALLSIEIATEQACVFYEQVALDQSGLSERRPQAIQGCVESLRAAASTPAIFASDFGIDEHEQDALLEISEAARSAITQVERAINAATTIQASSRIVSESEIRIPDQLRVDNTPVRFLDLHLQMRVGQGEAFAQAKATNNVDAMIAGRARATQELRRTEVDMQTVEEKISKLEAERDSWRQVESELSSFVQQLQSIQGRELGEARLTKVRKLLTEIDRHLKGHHAYFDKYSVARTQLLISVESEPDYIIDCNATVTDDDA